MQRLTEVRRMVITELVASGFELRGGQLVPPDGEGKEVARAMHANQRRDALVKATLFIQEWEDRLLNHFANGSEIDPAKILPRIRAVETPEEAALFRFASLHWAVPVSQGYGRRTRFLVTDLSNGKLIGIAALGDPVFNLGVRDRLIGWDQSQRQDRLYNVFDAFVLGAVDPYRQLIAGKLVALCAVSDEIVAYLEAKYAGVRTQIKSVEKISRPVLVTTSSALGRSSIYNRLRMGNRKVFEPIGYTEGFGHFQFSNAVFQELIGLVSGDEGFRGNRFGEGPNWKIRTIRSGLERLGLSSDLLKHGIKREVFAAPLSYGWRAFLRGETDVIKPIVYPMEDIAAHYRTRWAIPRAARRPEYADWNRKAMRLSPELDGYLSNLTPNESQRSRSQSEAPQR
jgi:Druantia protein DruA